MFRGEFAQFRGGVRIPMVAGSSISRAPAPSWVSGTVPDRIHVGACDPACRISLVATRAEFEALEEPWNALMDRAGRPHQVFQTFDWLRHWTDHYLDPGAKLAIVAGWQADRLAMVWPTAVVRQFGIWSLTWMGEPVSPYGDVLVESRPDALDLMRHGWNLLRSLGVDVINLRGVRSDAAVVPILAEAGAISTALLAAPFLDLESGATADLLNRHRSAKVRSNRRRRLRRLHERGTLEFEQHLHGPAAADLIARALTLKRQWLKCHGMISPTLLDPRFDRFLRDLVARPMRTADTRVSAVRCNGVPVAIDISFSYRKWMFGHVIAHDTAFDKHGVGAMLADHSIETASQQGYGMFDMLPPAHPYKVAMANGTAAVGDWAVPLSVKGKLFASLWLRRARPWSKSAFLSIPLGVRVLILALYRRAANLRFASARSGQPS